MKKEIFIFLLLFSFEQNYAQNWELVWSDEFNYSGLPDPSNWDYEVGFIRGNELQYYRPKQLKNSRVLNGKLLIVGRKESYKKANYTSASLITAGKYYFTYGKIEARMKLPKGQGFWPAFWMLGQNRTLDNWPTCGEIDIMEHINNEPIIHGAIHWFDEKHVSSGGPITCDVTQYHNFAVEWDENSIKWFMDGNKYWEASIKDNINSTEEFHKPFYIIINLAIGGNWPKAPDKTTVFPDTLFVDYVRVYQNITK